jgi:hypothetical protein
VTHSLSIFCLCKNKLQLINNAGYFKADVEKLDCLDFADELKTIDICACGPLRVTAALINGGLLKAGSKVIMITSQGGSVSWRTVQNPLGGDYGHHVRFLLLAAYLWGCARGVSFFCDGDMDTDALYSPY